MYVINTFAISKLNNAEITAFFLNVQKAITNSTAEKLGVTDLASQYDEVLLKLVDQVYTTRASVLTAAMQAADLKRDQIYKRIRLRLQMVDVAEDNTAIHALRDVVNTHLLGKYGAGVVQLPYQEETAILKGFLLDLSSKLPEGAPATLGIADDITALANANDEFVAAYNQRAAAKADGDTGLTVKLRNQMTAIYQQITFVVQYLANTSDEANKEKATTCQAFIGVLNVLLSDAKRRYAQRLGGVVTDTEGNEGDTDEGSSTSGSGSSTSGSSTSGSTTDSGTSGSGSGTSGSGSGTSGSGSGSSDSTDTVDFGGGSSSTDSGSGSSTSGGSSSSDSGNSGSGSSDSGSGTDEEVVF